MRTLSTIITLALLSVSPAFAGENADTNFYIGQSNFPKGDSIEITSAERFPDRLVVKGHYDLVSADRADLALFITTDTPVEVPVSAEETIKIHRGKGDFTLTDPNLVEGMPHVTMYSVPGGKPFAGVYFGNRQQADDESKLDLHYYSAQANGNSSNSPGSDSGPNEALLAYLGSPIEPPANLDARYTAEGLKDAVLEAAHRANIHVKSITIDDSEFPYLVGVICGGSDAIKLKKEIKKMAGYEYGGSVGNDVNSDGSDTCNVFNMVPYSAFPHGSGQQIYHRLGLREQVFQEKLAS